jgi:TRAP-type C4-dicarboxylate transport system permease small subunit
MDSVTPAPYLAVQTAQTSPLAVLAMLILTIYSTLQANANHAQTTPTLTIPLIFVKPAVYQTA